MDGSSKANKVQWITQSLPFFSLLLFYVTFHPSPSSSECYWLLGADQLLRRTAPFGGAISLLRCANHVILTDLIKRGPFETEVRWPPLWCGVDFEHCQPPPTLSLSLSLVSLSPSFPLSLSVPYPETLSTVVLLDGPDTASKERLCMSSQGPKESSITWRQ